MNGNRSNRRDAPAMLLTGNEREGRSFAHTPEKTIEKKCECFFPAAFSLIQKHSHNHFRYMHMMRLHSPMEIGVCVCVCVSAWVKFTQINIKIKVKHIIHYSIKMRTLLNFNWVMKIRGLGKEGFSVVAPVMACNFIQCNQNGKFLIVTKITKT